MDRFHDFNAMQPGDSVVLLVSGTNPDHESGRWAKRTPVRVTRCAESHGRPADNFTYATDTAAARYETQPGDANPGHVGLHRFVREHGAQLVEAVEESALLRRAYRAYRRKAVDYRAGLSGRAAAIICKGADSAAACLYAAQAAVARGNVPLHAGPVWAGRGGDDGRPFRNAGNGEWLRWIENPESKGLRFVGFADEVDKGIEHEGWLLDAEFADEAARGAVYRLPAKNGRARFLAGYADPFNNGPAALTVAPVEAEPGAGGFTERHQRGGPVHRFPFSARDDQEAKNDEAMKEAARLADSIADHFAEAERDYQHGFKAGRYAREMAAEARDAGRRMVALCRDVRALWRFRWGSGAITAPMIRRHIHDYVQDLRAAREEYREKLAEARAARADSPVNRCFPAGPDHAADGWRDGYAEGYPM